MSNDQRFSELTLLRAVDLFREVTQAEIGRILLYLSMDSCIQEDLSVNKKANTLARFAKENPDHPTSSGASLWDEIVEQAVCLAHRQLGTPVGFLSGEEPTPDPTTTAFIHALKQDGFEITDEGKLRKTLPCEADLPKISDELHDLLDELDMGIVKGHLNQAIEAHTRGGWASANAQLRDVLEGLFDEIACRIDPANAEDKRGAGSRRLLAQANPPFFQKELGEWTDNGKNFIEGVFKRLHSRGSHPGLSDEADCTFRLHLVLIVAHYYVRRAKSYLAQEGDTPS